MARRFYRQAELEALIRYGPELSGLLELQRQAQQNRKQSIRGAKGNARAVINAVDVARPEVREIYDDADARLGRQTAMVASHNAELGPVSDTISAAAAIEAGAAKERIGEAKAASLESLSDRRVGAAQGRQFAVQQANSEFVDQIGQILNRKQDLRKEIGAFTQLTAGDLRKDAKDRALDMKLKRMSLNQQERNSLRSAGIDPATGAPIPGGKLDPDANGKPGGSKGGSGSGGSGGLTPLQKNAAAEKLDLALQRAKTLRGQGIEDINQAKQILTQGIPGRDEQPLHDPVTGKPLYNKDGTPKVKPGRPAIEPVNAPDLIIAAALEEAYLGHVTKQTAAKLRRRGLRPRRIGLTPPPASRPYTPSGPGSDAAQR